MDDEAIASVLDPAMGGGRWAIKHLAADIVAWLTSVAPDGTPQSSVVCFLWDGRTVLFYSRAGVPKIRNIRHNPRVSFHLQCDPHGDHMLSLEGTAAIDETAPPSNLLPAYVDKYREPYLHWNMGADQTAADFPVPIRVQPTRIRVW